jgi:hypothetical protein
MEDTMSTTSAAPGGIETRLLNEAYGAGAWHGPDLKAAIGDVDATLAYRRPAPGRHNIAEIALHHTFHAQAATAKILGATPEPFFLDGEDWFAVDDEQRMPWPMIQSHLDTAQRRLADAVAAVETGRAHSPLAADARRDLVLGITCHAIYHAGQIQLLKRLVTA